MSNIIVMDRIVVMVVVMIMIMVIIDGHNLGHCHGQHHGQDHCHSHGQHCCYGHHHCYLLWSSSLIIIVFVIIIVNVNVIAIVVSMALHSALPSGKSTPRSSYLTSGQFVSVLGIKSNLTYCKEFGIISQKKEKSIFIYLNFWDTRWQV